ncbi:ppk15 [Symbiodinium sp. CCMP2592]|nr:ppk15 [Symbiodinium sp. CCMP2592]
MVSFRKRASAFFDASCAKRARSLLETHPRGTLLFPSPVGDAAAGTDEEHNLICRAGDILTSRSSGQSFELLQAIGYGAFGRVARARSTNGQRVALKILKHKEYCAEVCLEAEQEVRILARLDHPHIVSLVDYFEFQGHLCIAMELLGPNLYELLVRGDLRGLPLTTVRAATAQLLSALEYLQNVPIIHGDLKPENVLLEGVAWSSLLGGRVPHFKLIDFGGANQGEWLAEDVTVQTLPYRAPEVLLGSPVGCAADMWSLGCICAELFVGLPLFAHSSDKDGILKGMIHFFGEPPSQMLQVGSRTQEFYDRVEEQQTPAVAEEPEETIPPDSLRWLWRLRLLRGICTRRRSRAPPRVVYRLRSRRCDPEGNEAITSLYRSFRERRYDTLPRRLAAGVPKRLAENQQKEQLRIRWSFYWLVRKMLILDPGKRIRPARALKLLESS